MRLGFWFGVKMGMWTVNVCLKAFGGNYFDLFETWHLSLPLEWAARKKLLITEAVMGSTECPFEIGM